jgi:hypothetical protein
MARYYRRCYDFEIEGIPRVRSHSFKDAIQKILEIVTDENAVKDMPESNYEKQHNSYFANTDPMFSIFKAHGISGEQPYMVCADPDQSAEVWQIVSQGTQPESYMKDWSMTALGKMCEYIVWMANTEENRSNMQDIVIKTVNDWIDLVIKTVNLGPMFSPETVLKPKPLSPEFLTLYWTLYVTENVVS